MHIFIKDKKTGKKITIDLERTTTIKELKVKITQKLVEYTPEQMIIFWGGEQIDNSLSIEEAGIKNEGICMLATRSSGPRAIIFDRPVEPPGWSCWSYCRLF